MKRVAIHQPNYFPWMGYFLKMASVDTFIYHDAVTLNTRGYTRRCYIRPRTSEDNQRLSVGLHQASQNQLISDVQLSEDRQWQADHWNRIKLTYQNAPHFDAVSPWLKELVLVDSSRLLSDHNINAISTLAQYLGLETQCIRSSELKLIEEGTNAKHISLITQVNGTHYLSGTGGRAYQDESLYAESNIQLTYLESYLLLTAAVGAGQAQLSILDYLFDSSQVELQSLINQLIG